MRIDHNDLARRLRALSDELLPPNRVQSVGRQLGNIVHAAEEVLGAGPVALALLDERDHARVVATTAPSAAALTDAQDRLRIGPGMDCLRTGELVAIADLAGRPDWAPLWREVSDAEVRSVMVMPIRVRDDLVGTLTAVAGDPRGWSAQQRRAGASFAELIGQLLDLASTSGAALADGDSASLGDRDDGVAR